MEELDNLVIKGIHDGRQAFHGPKIVQIDLTGKCNNNCIGCWAHSHYVKNPPRDKNIELRFDKIKELIEDLTTLKTEEIYLSGAGEPFLHPDILEIIELVKKKGIRLNIITNFTLIDKKKAKLLVDLDVDLLTASVWAATPQTYIKTHPGKTPEDFYKIKENIQGLSRLKNKEHKTHPHIKIYNVICNLNYHEVHQMVDFALDTQVEFIEFQIMDIIEGCTSFLALSDGQIKDIKEQFDALTKHKDLYFKELGSSDFKAPKATKEAELKEFPGRFIKIPENFFLKEWLEAKGNIEKEAMHSLICPKGLATLRSKKNPLIDENDNKIIFKFLKEKCRKCSRFKNLCPVDENNSITFNYLAILSFGSFLRRINSSDVYKQVYEKDLIDSLPCYAGWIYSRILSTGEVIPCCKATYKPLGNIYKSSFLDIWNSSDYQEFRYRARSFPKNDPYFKEINCYKSCDNVGMNLGIKESIFYDKKQKDLNQRPSIKGEAEGRCSLPDTEIKIIIPAHRFNSGNLNIKDHEFGKGIVVGSGNGFGLAEYKINFKESGRYELWSYYATEEPRPVKLYFDGNLITPDALSSTTSGWSRDDCLWFKELTLDINEGKHTLRIYTKGFIPHIYSFAFLKGIEEAKQKTKGYLSENIYQTPSSLKLLKDKFKAIGMIKSIFKLGNYISSGRLTESYLDILGIFNGQYAFKGPFHVQIDLTNNCNNNCIGCWCNSPLLEEKALSHEVKQQTLPFGLVKELLDELHHLGTKEIYFSGGGEPFIHPDIMEILEYAKKKNFICYVNTNFTLLDRGRIKRLIDLGIEHLTVSIWAATAKTYAVTHPNKNEETFRQIIENLKFLNVTKRKTPYIKLYNVIFNLNYHELKEMVMLTKETGSESVEFTLIDTVPGKTDRLLLSLQQIKELQQNAEGIAKCLNNKGYFDGVLIFRFDSFLRRISSPADLTAATYDRNIIDKIPCYIGWCFSRVMPNGDVNACLKAHRIPTGNLYQANFRKIWNGEKQKSFRKKTLVYEKKDPFFRLIGNDPDIKEAGCYKSCDDIGRNVHIHNRIMSLTPFERSLLKMVAKVKRRPKPYSESQKPVSYKVNNKFFNLIIKGIQNGRRAFIGPEHVVIDITNRCNERCMGCWLYSPLLKEKPDSHWLRQELDFCKTKSLIGALADLGTKRIRFTGGGEPFMHPKIMELIEYTKAKNLICCVTTNFSLLDRVKITDLIKLEVDELAVSLWASNSATYRRTHPGALPDTFERIRENLLILTNEKKEKPFVTLCNVICNLNYLEVEEMFKFAITMKVDGVYFTLVDILEGTDTLLLDREQKTIVLKQTDMIRKVWQGLLKEKRIKLDYFEGFISRLKEEGSSVGRYDQERVNQIPCYVGWIFSRILIDGTICPCCRGVKKPMGNINQQDFKDIWFGTQYNEFRAKAKYLSKNDLYFREIGCSKMCDNLMHNEEMHKIVAERR